MRYPPEHKERTRRRILREAARLFRRRGYHGVGIDGIMSAVGLTRGGFYGHFRSKAALFAEVLRGEHDFNRRMRARRSPDRAALTREAHEIVAGYLDPANRERVGRGCFLAALSPDVARAGGTARAAYAERLDELVGEFSRGLEDPQPRDPRALASVALCVGGLVLSRAVGEPRFADAISRACRDAVREQLVDAGEGLAGARG